MPWTRGATTCGSASALKGSPKQPATAILRRISSRWKTRNRMLPPRVSPLRCWPGCPFHARGHSWITSEAFISAVITIQRRILRSHTDDGRREPRGGYLPVQGRDRRQTDLRGGGLLA